MNNKKIRYYYITVGIIFLSVILLFYVPKFTKQHDHAVGYLTEWNSVDDSGEEYAFTLPHKLSQDKNGNIELSTVLPDSFKDRRTVCFWTYYQSVDVFLDGVRIYEYDNSHESLGEASSSQWNYVTVAPESQGKVLKIKTYTPYSDVSLRLTEVVYGDTNDVRCWLEGTFGVYHSLDNFFMWVGVVFILLAFIQKVDMRYKLYQLYAGVILFLFSVYLRTGTKGLPIYWMSSYMKEFTCFFCLLMISIPLTMYIRTRVIRKPHLVLWCNILIALEMLVNLGMFTLNAFGVLDLHRSIKAALLLLFVSVATGIYCCIYYFVKERARFSYITLCSLICIIFVLTLEYLQFYQLNTLPFDTGFLSHIGATLVIVLEAVSYIMYLNSESRKRQRVIEENKNLQLQMLTSQIRPHFILNTIGAIRTLIYDDADRASDLLYSFSKYIRNNLEQKDYSKPIPFPEELDYIETYLSLEGARFGDRIKVEYQIETTGFWVMPLTVQPFVENAIKHGLFPSRQGGTLRITTKAKESSDLIRIEDNGVGFDTSILSDVFEEKKSVGMRSAILRLEREMDAKVSIRSSTDPAHSGTCVEIEIPGKRSIQK